MSRGSYNYTCYKIENNLIGRTHEAVMDNLIKGIIDAARDLERAESGDYLTKKFKVKWLKTNKNERLLMIADEDMKDEQIHKCIILKEEKL